MSAVVAAGPLVTGSIRGPGAMGAGGRGGTMTERSSSDRGAASVLGAAEKGSGTVRAEPLSEATHLNFIFGLERPSKRASRQPHLPLQWRQRPVWRRRQHFIWRPRQRRAKRRVGLGPVGGQIEGIAVEDRPRQGPAVLLNQVFGEPVELGGAQQL